MKRFIVLAACLVLVWGCCGSGVLYGYDAHVQQDNIKLVVYKSLRRLAVYSGDTYLKGYPVGLGFNPVGHKEREGDGRTPEGEYYISVKNPQSSFHLSLGISYPGIEDALRGMSAGQIDQGEFRRIVEAQNRLQHPPQKTALGGDIYIHGNGASGDWTWGCVAMNDVDIDELFAEIKLGTKIIILP